jgi:hypothetical protein
LFSIKNGNVCFGILKQGLECIEIDKILWILLCQLEAGLVNLGHLPFFTSLFVTIWQHFWSSDVLSFSSPCELLVSCCLLAFTMGMCCLLFKLPLQNIVNVI